MTAKRAIKASILAVSLGLGLGMGLTGCNSAEEMTQEEVRFLSHIDQSKFYQRQGELKASTQEARSAIEILPTHIEPYLLIIDNLVQAGDGGSVERQVATLREQIEAGAIDQPSENRLSLLLARGHYLQGEMDQASAALETIQEPSTSQALDAALLRGEMAVTLAEFDKARAAYEEAQQLDEQDVMPLIGLSKTAFLGGDPARARELITQAEALAEDDTELWLWKGQMAHREKRWDDARQGYEKALETIGQYDIMTFRKYQTLTALVEVLRAQGNAQQAFVYEEILAKSGPGTLRSGFESAQDKYQSGDLNGAAEALEEILLLAPTHERAQMMLGLVRFQQGRPEDAERLLSSLQGMNNDEAERLLAATKLQLRQPEAARKLLENVDENETNPGTLALAGLASLASGDDTTGRQYLEKALELAPDNTQLRVRYARYLAANNDMPAATEQLNNAIERAPDSAEAYLTLARLQAGREDYAGAEQTLANWRKAMPDNAAALISSGDLAATQDKTDRAKTYYQQALKASPEDARVHIALGNLERRSGNDQAAIGHFKEAISRQPNNREALRGLVQASTDNGSAYQATLDWLQALGEEQPKALGPRMVLLEDALRREDYAAANQTASTIAELAETPAQAEPLLTSLYTTVANQAIRDDNPAKALDVLDLARNRYPDSEALTLLAAQVHLRQGDEDQAMALIKAAKETHNNSAKAFLIEADYRASQGSSKGAEKEQLEQAANLYALALEKDNQALTSLKLSAVLQKDGQPNRALKVLESASTQHPNSAQIKLALAMAYQATEATDKAQSAYEALVQLTPKNAIALNNLAWIYYEKKDDRAIATAEKAYQINSRSPAIADTYGWILFSAGRTEESLPVLEAAHEMAPTAQEIALHLAEAYKAAGQNDKAKSILEKI